MRPFAAVTRLLPLTLLALQPAAAAVRYFDISGSTAGAENACPIWVLQGNQDDCSYNGSNPSGLGTAQWIGPVFSAGYYAPGGAPAIFTNTPPAVPVTAPVPALPLGGETGIPITRGFISIDDKGTADPGDDTVGGTIEFGPFDRNVATGPATRAVEHFDRIIHRIVLPAVPAGSPANTPPPDVTTVTANASGGFDYVVGVSGGAPVFPGTLSGTTDSFPSAVASQSSSSAADVSYWSAPGAHGIATFEGATAITGNRTAATVWGYTCNAGTGPGSCLTSDVNWDGNTRARFDNVLLRLSTDSSGNITAASAFLINESDLSSAVAGNESWQATTLSFTGSEDPRPDAFDDRVIMIASGSDPDPYLDISVLGNDVPGVAPVTVSIVSQGTQGTAQVLTTPATEVNWIRYTPNSHNLPNGEDSVTYRITDANNDTSTAILSVVLTDPIACTNDSANSARNVASTINVLANDTGADIPPVTVAISTAPTQGTAVVNPDKSITFTPPADTGGMFTFSYMVNDGTAQPAQCSVAVQVDSLPVAVADTAAVASGVVKLVDVLGNDTGLTDTPVIISIVSAPAHGNVLVVPAAGDRRAYTRYASAAGYAGADSFRYRATDSTGDFSEATVSVTVSDAHPGGVADGADPAHPLTVNDGVASAIPVLANDTGLVDTPLVLAVTSPPTHGTAVVIPASTGANPFVSYTPTAGYAGTDAFSYTVTDADGDVSAATPVTITVADDVPDAQPDAATTAIRAPISIDVTANDHFLGDTPITIEITQQPTLGSVRVVGSSSSSSGIPFIQYTSNAGAAGTDTLKYRLRDSDGSTSPTDATVTITVTNTTTLLATDDATQTIQKNTAKSLDVMTNDIGRDNTPLTLTITQPPSHGSAAVIAGSATGDPRVVYTPTSGYTGDDSFRYNFRDADGDTSPTDALVPLTIKNFVPHAVNDPPNGPNVPNGDSREATAFDVLLNDLDIVDLPVTMQITQQPTHGTATMVTIARADGTKWPGIGYASDKNSEGVDTMKYTVTDADGDVSNEGTLTLPVTNATPGAVNDAGGDDGLLPLFASDPDFVRRDVVIENLKTPIDVLHNDTGRTNRPLTLTISSPPDPHHGTATVLTAEETGNGRPGVIYHGIPGFSGTDSFGYKFADGDDQESNEATVTFSVVSIPTAVPDGTPIPIPTNEGKPITVNVLDNDGGLAHEPIRVAIVAAVNGTAVVNTDNTITTITFTPAAGFTGRWPSPNCPQFSCALEGGGVRYSITDALNQRAEASVFIDVLPPAVTDSGGSSAVDVQFLALLAAGGVVRRRPTID